MHKKAIALLSVLLVLVSLTTACAKHSKYGKVYVDDRGMEHVLVTDKNGETIVNVNGDLVEVMTDSRGKPIPAVTENGTVADKQAGEYQTSPVTFPSLLVDKNKAEDQYFRVDIPSGWTADENSDKITLTQTSTGAQVVLQPHVAQTAETAISNIKAECEGTGVEVREDSAVLDGLDAKVLRYTVFGTNFTAYAVNNDPEFASTIVCMTNDGKADATDFDEVLSNIHFK